MVLPVNIELKILKLNGGGVVKTKYIPKHTLASCLWFLWLKQNLKIEHYVNCQNAFNLKRIL